MPCIRIHPVTVVGVSWLYVLERSLIRKVKEGEYAKPLIQGAAFKVAVYHPMYSLEDQGNPDVILYQEKKKKRKF